MLKTITTTYLTPASVFRDEQDDVIRLLQESLSVVIEVTKEDTLIGYFAMPWNGYIPPNEKRKQAAAIVTLCSNIGESLRTFSHIRSQLRFRLLHEVRSVEETIVKFKSVNAFLDHFNVINAQHPKAHKKLWRPLKDFIETVDDGKAKPVRGLVEAVHYPVNLSERTKIVAERIAPIITL